MSALATSAGCLRFKKSFVGLFGFFLAIAPVPSLAETSPPQTAGIPIPDGQIDKAVAGLDGIAGDIMKRSGVPGMAIAVVRDGKTVYAKGFGVRKIGENQPVDADTVFQIASLSKSLTASVIAHQVGAGIVKWETPVVAHLPWFKLMDPWITQHVTIADMMAHRSGLPDHAGDDLEDFGYDRRSVLERLRLLPLHGFRDVYDPAKLPARFRGHTFILPVSFAVAVARAEATTSRGGSITRVGESHVDWESATHHHAPFASTAQRDAGIASPRARRDLRTVTAPP